MKGDFSRLSFDPVKRYSSVRQQQGRVLLDADWNEQQDILSYRLETGTIDQLGRCVMPRFSDFQLLVVKDAASQTDLLVTPGRAYVEGILVDQSATVQPATLVATAPRGQLRLPTLMLDGRELAAGQWLEIAAGGLSPSRVKIALVDPAEALVTVETDLARFGTAAGLEVRRLISYLTQPQLPGVTLPPPGPPPPDGRYAAYLDVWDRHITALEDPSIAEVALGGADTTTRVETVWQLKLAKVATGTTTAALAPGWSPRDPGEAPAGRLRARVSGTVVLENQLYRVEVHQTGFDGTATFKWSRDNGTVVARVAPGGLGAESITIAQAVQDEERQFEAGMWVEVTNDEAILRGEPGVMVELTGVDGLELTLLGWPGGSPPEEGTNPVVRAWSTQGVQPLSAGGYLALEDGIEIAFDAGFYRTGEYWWIPSRLNTNSILWPVDGNDAPVPMPSRGIRHAFCPIALVDLTEGTWTFVGDARRVVPASVELDGSKVNRAGDTMTGPLILQGADLTVGGETTLQAGLQVAGNAIVEGGVTVKQLLTAESASNLHGSVSVGVAGAPAAHLGVTGNATVGGTVTAGGPAQLNQTLDVNGVARLHAGTEVTGNASVSQQLTVGQRTFLNGGVTVGSDAVVNGEVKSVVGGQDFYMVPRGAIIMWSGRINEIPAGWALCNGQTVSWQGRTVTPPNLTRRFIVGAELEPDAAPGGFGQYRVGDAGGADVVTLGEAQIPPHSHLYDDIYLAEAWGNVAIVDYLGNRTFRGSNGGMDFDNNAFEIRRWSQPTGGGQAHENRPPFLALAYIMKL